MHTIIQSDRPPLRLANGVSRLRGQAGFRSPNYDCREQPGGLTLTVYLPGVNASTVQIEARGPDLVVIADKERYVQRPNWIAMNIESAQLDYRLRLRLGHGFDYGAMKASLDAGVLTIAVPKLVVPSPATAVASRIGS